MKAIEHHATMIEKLLSHNTETIISFASIREEIKSLCEKIDLGIKFISTAAKVFSFIFGIFITFIGGFWIYQNDIDNKYMNKMEHIQEMSKQHMRDMK